MTPIKLPTLLTFFALVLVGSNFTQRLGWDTKGVMAAVAASLLLTFIGSIAVRQVREYLASLSEQAAPFIELPPPSVPIDRVALLLLVAMPIINLLASPLITPHGWILCAVFNIILACLSPAILIFRSARPDRRKERLVLLYIRLSRAGAVLGLLPLILLFEGAPVPVANLVVFLILPALLAWNVLFFWFMIRVSRPFRFLKAVVVSRRYTREDQETVLPLILVTRETDAQPKQEFDQPQITYPDMPPS